MHGMGSVLTSYEKNILWLREAFPGIYVKNMNVYPGPPGQFTSLKSQMARTVEAIRADPMLANGFNFYGESQGGLVARVYVSEYNDPPVYNLVSNAGPQAGVGMCPLTEDFPILKAICASGASYLGIYEWPKCSFCEFWKGQNKDKYLRRNQWLKDVNNDIEDKDFERAERMKTLNAYMASAASNDGVVQPRESAWHTFWDWGGTRDEENLVPWQETESYKGDWLGLKTLDEQGRLTFNMYEGEHTKYEPDWWKEIVQPMFNNTL
jgi:palmitoyl-protein thioesterase